MTRPRGPLPMAVRQLDDCLGDAARGAETQLANTRGMLGALHRIFADGKIDPDDRPDVLYLRRHVRLEHRLNEEQLSLAGHAQAYCNRVVDVVQELRGRLQRRKASAEASQHPVTS
ncbi:MAG: hypothetical protein M1325_01090 [Actinobacteria bacterium]|nr:hypothetical protein [Actinomycetota bacterium]